MPKPNGCPHCGGRDLEAEADRWFCLGCAGYSDFHGNALPRGPEFRVPSFQERRAAGEVQ